MKLWRPHFRPILGQRLSLRLWLALWTGGLVVVFSLGLTLFITVATVFIVPRSTWAVASLVPSSLTVEVPLHSTPPAAPPAAVTTPSASSLQSPLREDLLAQVRLVSFIGLILATSLSGVGAYWLAGKALHPIRQVSQTARCINANSLNTRLALSGPEDELKELADAFDALLDRLARAFEQQGRFVADAAHELRTPLATIRTNLEVIQTDPAAKLDDYQTMAATLERTLTRLEQLVADLLLLAQDQQSVHKEEIVLGPLLEEILLNLRPLAAEQQVTLHIGGEMDVMVRGNGPLLAHAFNNLIQNGIAYNRRGGQVVVTVRRRDSGGVVTVADTGIGIPAEEQQRIFDRFYRIDHSRSRHKGGAGLGLSLVAHIVHLHGGAVQVESTPGSGSIFAVHLPV